MRLWRLFEQCCDQFAEECAFIFNLPDVAKVVIISEIADPANNGGSGNIRYVELFNLGCDPVFLSSGFALRRYSGTSSNFQVCDGLMMLKSEAAADSNVGNFPSECTACFTVWNYRGSLGLHCGCRLR